MKLYYLPGACALAPHIVANEVGIQLDLIKVDLATKKTEHGEDFLHINPNGYVPALVLDDGQVLTEVSALVQYLAEHQSARAALLPPVGTMARYRVLEALSLVATELHKGFGVFFKRDLPDSVKDASRETLSRRLSVIEQRLGVQSYIAGETYTIADTYLWVVLGWARIVKFDLTPYPNLLRWQQTVAERPAVQQSLKEEGLL